MSEQEEYRFPIYTTEEAILEAESVLVRERDRLVRLKRPSRAQRESLRKLTDVLKAITMSYGDMVPSKEL